MRCEFAVLGPLHVRADGRVLTLGGDKPRRLLASLLLSSGEPVSADRLIDVLWPERAPRSALANLRTYISSLRTVLGPRIRYRDNGYVIELSPGELDADEFTALLSVARHHAADPEQALDCYDRALALWRGAPLSDLECPLWTPVVSRFTETRLTAISERAELQLVLGRAAEAVAELRAATTEYPLQESLWCLLMRALDGAGRHAEAMAAYGTVRRLLATELGVEPGPELTDAHRRLLDSPQSTDAPTDVRTAALHRVCDRRLALVQTAVDLLHASIFATGERSQALVPESVLVRVTADPIGWLDAHREALVSLIARAAAAGLARPAWRLAAALVPYFDLGGHLLAWRRCVHIALSAARRCGDTNGETTMLRGLGQLYVYTDQFPAATEAFTAARRLCLALGDESGAALSTAGLAAVARFTDRPEEADSLFRQALAVFVAQADRHREAYIRWALAGTLLAREHFPQARDELRQSLRLAREVGDDHREAHVWQRLGELQTRAGAPEAAAEPFRRALELFDRIGDAEGASSVRRSLAALTPPVQAVARRLRAPNMP
ncbi:BTAD domain-containing putative transcriptional regulator [Phytomonospora endophytica]|uniref:DNA-binding SARP family transcriptional activator n=1 Tax=Phytomonospora endophytica TaxID=714109 RepID=A0A841FSQ3_9ACTN|nr:BTAD domain-containing putative transcriptional regulator [Phytomonospora endophytica]MBB6035010.1 DNA-binding SARP family transcriptional activator [Phytomonospora endophytica]GIG68264.1 hypothetical protein Pen01_45590 [Phytomonospora endophytica]